MGGAGILDIPGASGGPTERYSLRITITITPTGNVISPRRFGTRRREPLASQNWLNLRSSSKTMKYVSLICLSIMTAAAPLCAQHTSSTKNVVVFKESGRFGGWPANNGMWAWGNEMLVGFSLAYFKNVERGHAVDPDKPNVLRFARSLDGGETWKIETPSFLSADGKE